jgi:hypothetical protein
MSDRTLGAVMLLALSIPASALAAENYRCTNGDLVRRVEILYEPGRAVPCEVQYYKDTEAPGSPEVLWRAQNESGYCESKTAELVEQLESQGWSCGSGDVEEEVVIVDEVVTDDEVNVIEEDVIVEEFVESDDTEALSPAQDNN